MSMSSGLEAGPLFDYITRTIVSSLHRFQPIGMNSGGGGGGGGSSSGGGSRSNKQHTAWFSVNTVETQVYNWKTSEEDREDVRFEHVSGRMAIFNFFRTINQRPVVADPDSTLDIEKTFFTNVQHKCTVPIKSQHDPNRIGEVRFYTAGRMDEPSDVDEDAADLFKLSHSPVFPQVSRRQTVYVLAAVWLGSTAKPSSALIHCTLGITTCNDTLDNQKQAAKALVGACPWFDIPKSLSGLNSAWGNLPRIGKRRNWFVVDVENWRGVSKPTVTLPSSASSSSSSSSSSSDSNAYTLLGASIPPDSSGPLPLTPPMPSNILAGLFIGNRDQLVQADPLVASTTTQNSYGNLVVTNLFTNVQLNQVQALRDRTRIAEMRIYTANLANFDDGPMFDEVKEFFTENVKLDGGVVTKKTTFLLAALYVGSFVQLSVSEVALGIIDVDAQDVFNTKLNAIMNTCPWIHSDQPAP